MIERGTKREKYYFTKILNMLPARADRICSRLISGRYRSKKLTMDELELIIKHLLDLGIIRHCVHPSDVVSTRLCV